MRAAQARPAEERPADRLAAGASLLPYLQAPRYRVEARGGAIVGRREEA